jgi:Chaperone of endosialidase
MEGSMKSITRLVALVAGVVLLLNATPSWSQPVCVAPGCNPTTSDTNFNTAGGTGALVNLDQMLGFNNTAFGESALNTNTFGSSNTAIGGTALLNNTSGGSNTASGYQALFRNETGSNNTATGANALVNNTTGNNNAAGGANALESNSTGNLNAGIGFQALQDNAAGNNNTAIGAKALKKSTGTKNIGIGFQAGVSLIIGNNNIYIGNQGAGDEFQTVEIDTTTGQLGVVPSSARYKQDIASMGTRSEKVLDLRPVTFAYKDDARAVTHYGLIAEEVATVYPDLVTRTASGEVQTVKYQELIPMLLNELQRQQRELADLASLRKELAELRGLLGSRLEK